MRAGVPDRRRGRRHPGRPTGRHPPWRPSRAARRDRASSPAGSAAAPWDSRSRARSTTSRPGRRRLPRGSTADSRSRRRRSSTAAKRVAGPDVVSTVVLGLTVGDAFAAGTGVHVPSYLSAEDGRRRRRARGGATARRWSRRSGRATAPGPVDRRSPTKIDPLTGMLMLSSTDVVSKCRLLVDQAPLVPSPDDVTSDAAASGATLRRPAAAGVRATSAGGLPSMLGFRELAATGGSDATTKCLGLPRLVDRRHALRAFRDRHAHWRPPRQVAVQRCSEGSSVRRRWLRRAHLPRGARPTPHRDSWRRSPPRTRSAPRATRGCSRCSCTSATRRATISPTTSPAAESEPLVPLTGGAAKVHLTAEDCVDPAPHPRHAGSMPRQRGRRRLAGTALSGLIRSRWDPAEAAHVVIAPDSTPAVVPPLGWALSEHEPGPLHVRDQVRCGLPDPTTTVRGGPPASHDGPTEDDSDERRPPRRGRYVGLAEFADERHRVRPLPAGRRAGASRSTGAPSDR